MQQLAPSPSQPSRPIPYGLVSLWDMINFYFSDAFSVLEVLRTRTESLHHDPDLNAEVTSGERRLACDAIMDAEKALKKMGLDGPLSGMMQAKMPLNRPSLLRRELGMVLDTVRGAFGDEMRKQLFFRYSEEKGRAVEKAEVEWRLVITAFPSSKDDIVHGVDCWASEHNTAAVFYMMRVAEVGLRAVAKERKIKLKRDKPLTHAQWGEIIQEIDKEVKRIELTASAGPNKDAAVAFYSGASSHARALKDRYRNRVMHAREAFSEYAAADASFHTKSFMSGLAEKLNEKSSRSINWKL